MVKAALAQFSGMWDPQANRDKAAAMAREAARAGAKIVCFPEIANTIYFCYDLDPKYFVFAEPMDGPSVQQMQAVARETGVLIVYPFYELDEGQRFNTAVVIGPEGDLYGKYRKSSIPTMTPAKGAKESPSDEKFFFAPNTLGFPVFDTPFGIRIGLLICYDRHFPEAARVLGLRGADLVLVPTATFRPWVREVWEIELRAHAIANNYYVGGVNKVGLDERGAPDRWHFGSSLFIDPRGQVLVRAGDQHDEIVYADIDRSLVQETRERWGFFRERRPDLYGPVVEPIGEETRRALAGV